MEHRRHIIRLLTIAVAVVAGFLVVRSLLVPESFGKYGHYRGDNIPEQMNLPLVYQGADFCKECHEKQYTTWQGSGHAKVNCEVCHGHWEIHNENVKTVTADKSIDACLICHQKLTGRPEAFPQIVSVNEHLKDTDNEGTEIENCLDCHNPHEPL